MNATTNANPWVVREAAKAGVPDGSYLARFVGVAAVTNAKWDGPRWRWTWGVASGPEQGRKAEALTQMDISPATHAGRLIAGLLNRPIQPGEHVQAAIDACKDKVYWVSVQPGPKGGASAVRSVSVPPV